MQQQPWRGRALLCTLLVVCGLIFPVLSARAQTLSELQPLRFGRIVMHNNSSPRDLRLLPSGSYSADSGYYILDIAPQLGTYRVEGEAENAIMDVVMSLTGNINPLSGGSAYFTLVDFFTVPATVVTDGDGNATFQVGATLRSNGSGFFSNSNYLGSLTISVTPRP